MSDLTLREAKAQLFTEAKSGGADCPCCLQFTKIYRRIITSAMAADLILAYRTAGVGASFHYPDLPQQRAKGGDFAKLRYWQLIEEDTSAEPLEGARFNGHWRITSEGYAFLAARLIVPKHAIVYDGHLWGLEGPDIDIVDALNSKFNYRQLMDD